MTNRNRAFISRRKWEVKNENQHSTTLEFIDVDDKEISCNNPSNPSSTCRRKNEVCSTERPT